ncbi:hypothetical protein K7X08_028259 [Anisodus acutangulus]|uniref:Uncharacterized protein n=1 Tax=Anisodus acutangulus TaxID=402998 RepID=A0A9Q1RE86_9SOLA|nr:hypothetical protein K7X08_028259 [Anisodus acutangulus]
MSFSSSCTYVLGRCCLFQRSSFLVASKLLTFLESTLESDDEMEARVAAHQMIHKKSKNSRTHQIASGRGAAYESMRENQERILQERVEAEVQQRVEQEVSRLKQQSDDRLESM